MSFDPVLSENKAFGDFPQPRVFGDGILLHVLTNAKC